MNTIKYIISAGLVAILLGGTVSLVLAEDIIEKKMEKSMDAISRPKPMIVEIGPAGKTILRGTVKTVDANSLTVASWGGDWTINISSDTKVVPETDLSKFKAGDFVGVQGSVNKGAAWTVNARLVRNWTERKEEKADKKEEKTNKKEIKEMMKQEKPRNWAGTASDVNVDAKTLILTVNGVAYTVNLTANAKIVSQKFLAINFSDIKNGDRVDVFGPVSGATITASAVRDISITGR